MRIHPTIAFLMMTPLLPAVEWSIEQCSSLDLLAGRTGVADVRPSNDPHHNSSQMMEQNSGIYRGQWSWQSEMPELLYSIMESGEAHKTSPSGFTALHAACVYADEGLFSALIEAGVPVDSRPGDWQQLGYVGDTPLGMLIRFMTPRSAAARVRMARVLLEKGAQADAPMTTWSGNRVVTTVPFCELGNQEFNHDMRMLLLQHGEQDLKKRMAGWPLNWEWYRADLVARLRSAGMAKAGEAQIAATSAEKREVGTIPLLDLIRKGDVEGVRLALESGASIEVSPRARRYGQEPLFNIPARRKDSPEAAVEIARLLIEAGADVNALNRRGRSLRIHYDRYYSKASRALCAYFRDSGSLIHPDSPDKAAEVEQTRKAARERAAAFAAKRAALIAGASEAEQSTPVFAEQPAPADPTPVSAEQPAPADPTPVSAEQTVPADPTPVSAEPPVPADPTPVSAEQPVPADPTPVSAEQPALADPTPVSAEPPAPADPTPVSAEQPVPAVNQAENEHTRKIMLEVQDKLAELQAKYEAEQRAHEAADAAAEQESEGNGQ